MIDIADFFPNVSDLYFNDFGIQRRPNIKSSKIVELLERVLQEGVGIVSGEGLY